MTDDEMIGLRNHQDYPDIVIVICLLAIFSIFGTIGNAFVLYVYGRKKDKTTTTIFILSLAGTDFFTCLVIIPFTIVVEYVAKRIRYDSACKIYQFLITSNVPFSAFIMVIIAFDRYLKLCRPWNHALNTKVAKRVIIFLFVFALLLGVITAFIHGIPNDINFNINKDILSVNSTDGPSSIVTESLGGKDAGIYSNQLVSTLAPATTNVSTLYVGTNTSIRELSLVDASMYKGDLCLPTERYISREGRNVFQKFYASLFLVCFILVLILYSLVFRSLVMRRSRRAKKTYVYESTVGQQTNNHLQTTTNCTMVTKSTMTENFEVVSLNANAEPKTTKKPRRVKRQRSTRSTSSFANIKTAVILFIVTIVFIAAFLPAWLMAMRVFKGNIIVFYMHFSYNVANPIIYAFFNQNFRKDIKRDCGIFMTFDKQNIN